MNTGLIIVSGPTGSGKNTATMALASQVRDSAIFTELHEASQAQRAVAAAQRQRVFTTCHATYAATVPARLQRFEVTPDYLADTLLETASRRRLSGCCPFCASTFDLRDEGLRSHQRLLDTLTVLASEAGKGDGFSLPRVAAGRCRTACVHCAGRSLHRVIVEKVSYEHLSAETVCRPESEWWDEAVRKGGLIPLWYQAAALLLRREITAEAFFDFFAWRPPYQSQLSRPARQRLANWLFAV